MHKHLANRVLMLVAAIITVAQLSITASMARSPQAGETSRTFPETGKTVSGKFLTYWDTHGGLAQQGYPISSELQEISDTDGKVYTVQYFERAVFELHPELAGTQYEVLLSLLGNFSYAKKYQSMGGAPGQQPNREAGSVFSTQTGKRLGGLFLQYWQTHGGLAQQGFPISDEFMEKSDLDGKTYRVQYFERAVFEYHPENKPPFNVLLSQLGTYRYRDTHNGPTPSAQPTPLPEGTAAPTSSPATTPEARPTDTVEPTNTPVPPSDLTPTKTPTAVPVEFTPTKTHTPAPIEHTSTPTKTRVPDTRG